jgi:hypothetical protein
VAAEVPRRTATDLLRLTRREAIRIVAGAVLTAAICWYFGVDVLHAILLGCAITVLGLAVGVASAAPEARDLSWIGGARSRREGSRNDVSSLSSSLHVGWGLVGLTAERQLHQLARRRLALEGLDLQNADHRAAIESRIGTRAYRALVLERRRQLRLRTLMHCLQVLDALNPTYYPAPQHRLRGRERRPNPGRTLER